MSDFSAHRKLWKPIQTAGSISAVWRFDRLNNPELREVKQDNVVDPFPEAVKSIAFVNLIFESEEHDKSFKIKIERALSRLEEFETLEEDWDSYGAAPIDKTVIEEARKIFKLAKNNEILRSEEKLELYPIPTNSGGITVYVEMDEKELRIKLGAYLNRSTVVRVGKKNPEKFTYKEIPYELRLDSHFLWLIGDYKPSYGINEWKSFQITTNYSSESVDFTSIQRETSKATLSHRDFLLRGTVVKSHWTGLNTVNLTKPSKEQRTPIVESATS